MWRAYKNMAKIIRLSRRARARSCSTVASVHPSWNIKIICGFFSLFICLVPLSTTSNPFCHYRSTGGSVSESQRLQSRSTSAETLIHSLRVGPLPGERGISRVQRQALREEKVQKQALVWQRWAEGKLMLMLLVGLQYISNHTELMGMRYHVPWIY